MKKPKYKTVQILECGIRDAIAPNILVHMNKKLQIISNGRKFGIQYATNDQCFPVEKPHYQILFDCIWDHFNVIDTEYGAYVAAFFKGKFNLFQLLCKVEKLETSQEKYQSLNYITIKQVTAHKYASIYYNWDRCKHLLLLKRNNKMQYYVLNQLFLSSCYDSIEYLDEEFVYCIKNDNPVCINIKNDMAFPSTGEFEWVTFLCKYYDGRVYHILTNRDYKNSPFEAYLIFYSKKENKFYKTDVYDEITTHTYSINCCDSYLSFIECKKGQSKTVVRIIDLEGAEINLSSIAELRNIN